MKITFFSNFLNHHQLPFCQQMYSKLGDNFKFIATTPVPQSRLNMGYYDMNKQYPFVISTYDSMENKNKAMKLCLESDVIITGSAPEIYTLTRMKENKLTFRYSERIYKNGVWRVLSPRGIYNMIRKHTIYKNKKLYMLCASAYTAGDFSMVGAYKNKTLKWGYFTKLIEYDIGSLIKNKPQEKIKLLWCGRFIKFKHPEKAIFIAKELKKEGYNFQLDMIGTGELEENIKKIIKKEALEDCINLVGKMTPDDVRVHMEKSNIFLFTSNYGEGWGAVINEAMNSGCAVVASHAIGSVPFLIENRKNGLIYRNNNYKDLYSKVKLLMDNKSLREELSQEAYNTINNDFNGDIAAERFIDLANSLINNREIDIKEGPCSKASPIYQWNMFKRCVRRI